MSGISEVSMLRRAIGFVFLMAVGIALGQEPGAAPARAARAGRGEPAGPPRPPLTPLSADDHSTMQGILRDWGLSRD